MEPGFPGFMNEKLEKAPDDERSIKQCYLDKMQLFEYDQRDKKKVWAEKVAAREKHLMSRIR